LSFEVTSLARADSPEVNFVNGDVPGIKARVDGTRVYLRQLDEPGPGLLVRATLENPAKRRIQQQFPLSGCRTRKSVVLGDAGVVTDSAGIDVRGRLKGCTFNSDWWISAHPMFGAGGRTESAPTSTGEFTLLLPSYGNRHIVEVGRDKEVLLAFGADVQLDKPLVLGEIDMSGRCVKVGAGSAR
jgi:hypothetical protein